MFSDRLAPPTSKHAAPQPPAVREALVLGHAYKQFLEALDRRGTELELMAASLDGIQVPLKELHPLQSAITPFTELGGPLDTLSGQLVNLQSEPQGRDSQRMARRLVPQWRTEASAMLERLDGLERQLEKTLHEVALHRGTMLPHQREALSYFIDAGAQAVMELEAAGIQFIRNDLPKQFNQR